MKKLNISVVIGVIVALIGAGLVLVYGRHVNNKIAGGKQTMPVLVSAQNQTRGPQWWYMCVLIVIMIAPVIVIATFLQKHIARGLLVGAVKG